MQIARETDLPELLSHLGYQVKRVGRFHTTAEMDSLRIKDRRTWFRYSQGIGGDAITFLQQFCDKTFPEAVEYLLTFQGKARDAPVKTKPVTKQDEPPKEFALPPRNVDDRRVFAYLRKRGIAAQVIRQFMNSGSLYEDAVHHNCVFVGRDHTGQARYAGLRGTMTATGKGFAEMYPAAGLPLTSFGRDKKAFQDYLCRVGKPVSFRYEGQDYAVTISNILRNYANSNRNKEQRVYQELKEYNFWRNLYGTKGIALVVYLLIIVREITLRGTIDIKIFF